MRHMLLIFLLAVPAPASEDQRCPPELVGTWHVRSLSYNAHSYPGDIGPFRVLFSDNRFPARSAPSATLSIPLVMACETSPGEVVWQRMAGNMIVCCSVDRRKQTLTFLGFNASYQLKGDTLTLTLVRRDPQTGPVRCDGRYQYLLKRPQR